MSREKSFFYSTAVCLRTRGMRVENGMRRCTVYTTYILAFMFFPLLLIHFLFFMIFPWILNICLRISKRRRKTGEGMEKRNVMGKRKDYQWVTETYHRKSLIVLNTIFPGKYEIYTHNAWILESLNKQSATLTERGIELK